ncbi:MAG: thioredoxin domain-containing protein [Candidatus Sumerlaeia bacterium]
MTSNTHSNTDKKRNRLADASSPYLLQHADNPVDWYPWGDEAFEKARKEDKPIFLSIGYSSCHWCHVMAHESFEDEATAKILNEHFICIKVDREERPGVDEIYMSAVMMMTGSGGWPLSVFLTPELEPFYGGTYFPPESRYGMPGFRDLLTQIASMWKNQRQELLDNSTKIMEAMESYQAAGEKATLDGDLLSTASRYLMRSMDPIWGGTGGAPKFPSASTVRILIRQYKATGDEEVLEALNLTLERMAYGGMYDQLGGGFHRYSVDERWLVPHFEKMLYDNAQLAQAYLEAWQVTGKPLYERIARETLDYLLRDMMEPKGGFHSAEDADSPGGEGAYYVWTPEEIEAIVAPEDVEEFKKIFGVTVMGNFEGKTILNVPKQVADSTDNIEERITALRGKYGDKLLETREKRPRPSRDDKILAAWNGMAISSLAKAAQVLGDEKYAEAARLTGEMILEKMRTDDGKLVRSRRGTSLSHAAYVDDYAEVINALVDLYETDFDPGWIGAAEELAEIMIADFYDNESEAFYFTNPDSHQDLIMRTRPFYDGPVPSGNAAAVEALLRLSLLTGKDDWRKPAESALAYNGASLKASPMAHMSMILAAWDYQQNKPFELAIVGDLSVESAREMLDLARVEFHPNKVLAALDPGSPKAAVARNRIPLLQDRVPVHNRPTAWLCRNFACKEPVTGADNLAKLLD